MDKTKWLYGVITLVIGLLCFFAGYLANSTNFEENGGERMYEKLSYIESGCVAYKESPFDDKILQGKTFSMDGIKYYTGELTQCFMYTLYRNQEYGERMVIGYGYLESTNIWYLHAWNLDNQGNIVDVNRLEWDETPFTRYYGYQLKNDERDTLYNFMMGSPTLVCM